ncbi:hypothetical protein [Nodularia sp. UHCC 0506]|nr:hypothetical protein [Nodularia sp. UHCC 0506]MEA5514298.1 hypothetical protein [Nodularia sp. UHCC 0506]
MSVAESESEILELPLHLSHKFVLFYSYATQAIAGAREKFIFEISNSKN